MEEREMHKRALVSLAQFPRTPGSHPKPRALCTHRTHGLTTQHYARSNLSAHPVNLGRDRLWWSHAQQIPGSKEVSSNPTAEMAMCR
eukprot:1350209-Amphidinium_carterae.1